MMESTYNLRVEWGDCDPARIVFYPHYFRWFDKGTHRLFEQAGAGMDQLLDTHGGLLPIVDARASFTTPSRWGDELEITSWISEWKESSLMVSHRVLNSGQPAAEGHEIRVWVLPDSDQPGGLRSISIPQSLKSCFVQGNKTVE